MPRIAYVNGSYVPYHHAQVHAEDRGFQFADGVYEVMACIGGRFADERGHLDRLERSLAEMRIAMPVARPVLRFIIREVVRRSRLKNAGVYLQITRGAAVRDFKFPEPGTPPSLVVIASPFTFEGNPRVEKGITVVTVPDLRWKRRDIKTVGLLAQSLAKQEALDRGAQDAWMVDDDGYVTEGSASNAWIVTRDGRLMTRQVSHDILRGVTRTAIEHLCAEKGLTLVEQAFTPQQAYEAAEAFSSAATGLTVPVIEIDGHVIGDGRPGPVVRDIYKAYRDYAGRADETTQYAWEAGL